MMSEKKIDQLLLLQNLNTAVIGHDFHCFETVGSTNKAARQYAEMGAPDGTVIVAEHQSDGRGRLNRTWLAPPRSSILCSVIFYPALEPENLFRLTMIAAIAAIDALKVAAGVEAGIKWPNDIYAAGKKLCGILTEVDCTGGAVNYAVVGIGINVNWQLTGTELELQATSVQDLTGQESSRQEILLQLLQNLDARYGRLADSSLQEQWQQRCMHLGTRVRILSGRDCREGIARGITEQGHLLLENAGGIQEIVCGDVSLRW